MFGNDLKTLEQKGEEVSAVMARIPGLHDVKLLRDFGQPNLNFTIDRRQAARFGINVADIQDAIQTAVGGNAVSQVLHRRAALRRGGALPGALSQHARKAIDNIRLLSPTGERVSLAQLTKVEVKDGAYDIYREGNTRYAAVTFNVRGRDLGSTVEDAIQQISEKVKLPPGYRIEWSGEYESEKRAEARLAGGGAADHPGDLHHSLHDVPFVQMGAADSVERWAGARRAACSLCCSRELTSACLRASDSWRSSASPCRPA